MVQSSESTVVISVVNRFFQFVLTANIVLLITRWYEGCAVSGLVILVALSSVYLILHQISPSSSSSSNAHMCRSNTSKARSQLQLPTPHVKLSLQDQCSKAHCSNIQLLMLCQMLSPYLPLLLQYLLIFTMSLLLVYHSAGLVQQAQRGFQLLRLPHLCQPLHAQQTEGEQRTQHIHIQVWSILVSFLESNLLRHIVSIHGCVAILGVLCFQAVGGHVPQGSMALAWT